MDSLELTRTLECYLAEHPRATVAEDDEVLFELPGAHYSVSGEQGKCLLHLWSAERNLVRRVLEAEPKKSELALKVQRFGQTRPNVIHVLPEGERASPGSRAAERSRFRALLKHVVEREFPDYKAGRFTSAMDLEQSFGPEYARGVLRRGQSSLAVLGVGETESQASVDAALTAGLLWLASVRESTRQWTESLILVVPAGRSAVLRSRMAWTAPRTGRFRLFELDAQDGTFRERDCDDGGNIWTCLVPAPDAAGVHQRFGEAISKVRALLPDAEISAPATTEVVFRYRGLEFARSRVVLGSSFRRATETTFGLGAEETPLTVENAEHFAAMIERVRDARRGEPHTKDPLWRASPERWLESLVVQNVAALDPRLDTRFVYSQVPAFAAGDRAMIDVLTCTHEGRLAVLELKADEDLHLPLQGLDYWSRVKWHNDRGEFKKYGYFAGRELSPEPPLLLLVAPALHIHPQTDMLLKHLAPEVDWELIAVDERWRSGLKVVFRKRRS